MLSYVKYLAEQAYNLALSAYNYAKDVYNILKQKISDAAYWAIDRAKEYAYSLYIDINRVLRDIRHTISQTVNYYYSLVVDWVNTTLKPLWDQFRTIVGLIGQRISEAFHAFVQPIWDVLLPLRDLLQSWWQGILDGIRWVFTTGLSLPGQLATLWDYVKNTVIPSINRFVHDNVAPIVQTISNPWGMVYPYLKEYLWELLQHIIANQLGTVKYTLPPFPTFNFSGAGGSMPISDSLQIDNSDLHRPLDNLYISGYRFTSSHPGLDLGLTNGTPIYAMHDGIVDLAAYGNTGYAVQVVIRGSHWWSRYAHCQQLLVEKDEFVRAGQVIALGDSTGNSTGPHLHLEIKYNGQFVDPVTVLPL